MVLLIDIDQMHWQTKKSDKMNKVPNLALHKLAKYYSDIGEEVVWDMPMFRYSADKIFVSCVFTKNRKYCDEWEGSAEIGGSGYDLHKFLPEEIESVKPRINYGFTTRGCIRKCKFCIVPKKEGGIRAVGDLVDIWDGTSKVVHVLDNNILSLPEHFSLICRQARENRIKVDHNQGLDHRLLTKDIAIEMKATPTTGYRFSYDHPSYTPTVEKALGILSAAGIRGSMWYILVGFDTTLEQDMFRLNYMRDRKIPVYIMRYSDRPEYIPMARWASFPQRFFGSSFRDYLDREPMNEKFKEYYKWIA